jgi:hypothetical protein
VNVFGREEKDRVGVTGGMGEIVTAIQAADSVVTPS